MDLAEHGRILYVSGADVTQPNGPGVNEREFLLSLYERLGNRMHALIPAPCRPCDEIDRTRTTFYRNPRRWDLLGFLLQQCEVYWRVRRWACLGHFDLVVARLSVLPLAFYFLRRCSFPYAIKTLGDVQGFTQNSGLKGWVAKLLGPLNAWLFRQIVTEAVAIDCCTETHRREHLEGYAFPADKLIVVENATNTTRFFPQSRIKARETLGLSRFAPILGFVGGSPAERGGLQMLELASRLKHEWPSLGVVIVGDDRSGILKQRARALALEDRAVIPGVVPYEMIPVYVNSFDIGFALDRPARWQATGNSYQKVRQYLACGKPVITCIDSTSELAQSGLVCAVSADDVAAQELAVRRILGYDAAERARFPARAVQFSQERLSTRVSLERRLAFWAVRLNERSSHECAQARPTA